MLAITIYVFWTKPLYRVTEYGYEFTEFSNIYSVFGLINCILCGVTVYTNRKNVSMAVIKHTAMVGSTSAMLLITQIILPNIVFSSITYVMTFTAMYLLFHSTPYDEFSGMQNVFSFQNYIAEKPQNGIEAVVFCGRFAENPELRGADISNTTYADQIISEKLGQIREILPGNKSYQLSGESCAVVVKRNKISGSLEEAAGKVAEIIGNPITIDNLSYSAKFKLVVFENRKEYLSPDNVENFIDFLFGKLGDDNGNEVYVATDADYTEFHKIEKIDKLLMQMRTQKTFNDEHVLCYVQPIFNVNTNSFRTAEALMRLQMDGEIIYPDVFIPIAERNHCIHTLTMIMFGKICKQIKCLEQQYDFDSISINMSSQEFTDPKLADEVLELISDSEISCSKVSIEITESSMIENLDVAMENIGKLKAKGIKFYLDDFGTGYSNLERIISCPFDTIKFDKSLLYKSMDRKNVDMLMESLTKVFKSSGFMILIEGVEDSEQNSYCVERGFDYIQGYNYSKPRPIEELTSFFEKISSYNTNLDCV